MAREQISDDNFVVGVGVLRIDVCVCVFVCVCGYVHVSMHESMYVWTSNHATERKTASEPNPTSETN